ncbi:hypothetical protein CBR_g39771 [Chara braunii]|uniref:Integrase catalytic domain-containing protein n=1 Tax=Chara braunii TaxID=69332 RepID=A0A388LS92_CHABU|nr:hypothetical protein CBR_g39771 [Chara braunii]|eukprot:GBG85206.1 hypothetical protein CBR_g39771 [Chara braunii]
MVNFHRRTLIVRDAFSTEVSCTIPLPHPSIQCQVVTAKSFRATCAYEQRNEIGLCFLRTVAISDSSPTDLSSDPRAVRLLEEFADIFESSTGVVPNRPISHEIILEAAVVPPKGCIYRMSEEELTVLHAQLDDLFDKGWIRPSSSPYGAPVLFVRKKNKDLRLCIDYCKLNAQIVKNAGPLPRIEDLLERLGGAKNFSKLDLKSGYHQISTRPNDHYKSTFKTQYGHFEWAVMPFGLNNAPTTFQAAMTNEFRAMLDRFVLVYLDYILVYRRILEDHLSTFNECWVSTFNECWRRSASLSTKPTVTSANLSSKSWNTWAIWSHQRASVRCRTRFKPSKSGRSRGTSRIVDGILTVVDRLTKFAMFLPCRYHAKAPELAEVLYAGWIRTKGYPKEIVCDLDTRFISDFWLALIKRWGSCLKPSLARHPQTDGQTEREHQTAQVLLSTLIRPDQKDWVARLSDVELAYNSSIHPTIEMSPFEFERGSPISPVTSPLDTIIRRTAESDDHLLFLRRMQELLIKARDQMAKTQQRMSQQANRKRLPCPFRVGDLVRVSAAEFSLKQDISRKLLPKWMGPWSIVALVGDAPEGPSFTIQMPAHLPGYPVFHCSKLALYTAVEHDDFPGRRSQDPPSMDGFQEVGDIISQRRYGNKPTEYLVHFAYDTHKADCWLTRAELQATTPDVLARYEREMQGKPVSSAPRHTRI